MSYDIALLIDTGSGNLAVVEEVGNCTYNLAPMFNLALGCPLRELHGQRGGEVVARLQSAVGRMRADPETFRALNPPNGWGDAEAALGYLTALLAACERHPAAAVEIT